MDSYSRSCFDGTFEVRYYLIDYSLFIANSSLSSNSMRDYLNDNLDTLTCYTDSFSLCNALYFNRKNNSARIVTAFLVSGFVYRVGLSFNLSYLCACAGVSTYSIRGSLLFNLYDPSDCRFFKYSGCAVRNASRLNFRFSVSPYCVLHFNSFYSLDN